MQEFPANSAKARQRSEAPPAPERPEINQVTRAPAEQRKPGLGRKFRETFVGGSLRDAGEHMVTDVIVPAVKDMIYEAFEDGLQRMVYGASRPRSRGQASSAYSTQPRIDYGGYSKPPAQQTTAQRTMSRRGRESHDFGEIVVMSRGEAQDVIEYMFEVLSRHGEVAVSDLYIMTGIATSHVDHRWGWKKLPGVQPMRTRDGRWMLNLPKPEPLD